MELSLSLHEHLARSALLHSRLCPRQVIGVRIARLACRLLNVDPAIDRKQIYVYMEIGRCAADAVMVVTGASPTNGLMQLVSYGKVAATFVHRPTCRAVRISERPESRVLAIQMRPTAPTPWEAQRDAYQAMADDLLLRWQLVDLIVPLPTLSEKHKTFCVKCGDRIDDHSELVSHGRSLCKPCALGAYYRPLMADVTPMSAPLPDRPGCSSSQMNENRDQSA